MKRIALIAWLLAVVGVCPAAIAQDVVSSGERTQVHACFYQCKPGPTVRGTPTWQETTTFIVGRLDPVAQVSSTYFIHYLDGDRNIIARSGSNGLLSFDMDEVHVCRTLEAAGITPPEAGLAIMTSGSLSHYWWAKNLLGKFFVTQDEPFAGRVSGVAKFNCFAVPPNVVDQFDVSDRFFASGAPSISQVVVEGTAP